MKILFLPRYDANDASSRYRIYNYLEFYKTAQLSVTVAPLLPSSNLKRVKEHLFFKAFFSIKSLLYRINYLLNAEDYELLYIGGDLLPYLPYFMERFLIKKRKYIIDLDDAIFHNYDLNKSSFIRLILGNKFKDLLSSANHIITGSPYLTDYAREINDNVTEIPTSININKYKFKEHKDSNTFVIGWIGSTSTSKYILNILDALRIFYRDFSFELRLIGFDRSLENHLEGLNYKIIDWNKDTEVKELNGFDVGIMPLDESDWAKGKCGFKLIQYMASCKPTISTPLEANLKIDNSNGNLFATTTQQWVRCFKEVYLNIGKFREIGLKNRKIVESCYTVQANYRKYIEIINKQCN